MSWESSAIYYELINLRIREKLGGFHSSKCIMLSVDFAEIEELQHAGDWERLNEIMADSAIRLEKAGAEIIVLCTNTMHLCSNAILEAVSVPMLHIAEATGREIQRMGLKTVCLLGTKFTMEKGFYSDFLKKNFNIDVLIPDENDRQIIHDVIYNELVHGKIHDSSRSSFKGIIKKLQLKGAKGVILGCTEIPMLISDNDVDIHVLDTTTLHAVEAADWSISE